MPILPSKIDRFLESLQLQKLTHPNYDLIFLALQFAMCKLVVPIKIP